MKLSIKYTHATTDMYFDVSFSFINKLVDKKNAIIITDEKIFKLYSAKFKSFQMVVIKSGEQYKTQQTVNSIIAQLIEFKADRTTTLIGVGGGVVTDITGYVAGIYMRGVQFGFVPTSLLCMVDAAIGGKNGVDVGLYKNMVGTFRQPSFILYDINFLKTLAETEWQNGFAEIIKHAVIKDAVMFNELLNNNIHFYKKNKSALTILIKRNALLKTKVVQKDEFEKAERKILNFGHTLGHALENKLSISHGEAVSIGMVYAALFSQELSGYKDAAKLIFLIENYSLPTNAKFDVAEIMNLLAIDKKKTGKTINYILLEKTGKAIIHPLSEKQIKQLLQKHIF